MHARSHWNIRFLISLTVIVCLNVGNRSSGLGVPDRLPLQKKYVEIGQPAPMEEELEGYDNQGRPIYWDPQPRVVPLERGKYAFKWVGRSGRELTLIYERPDAVDVVVEAAVSASAIGSMRYQYRVRALTTSGLLVTGFVVQTFSQSITPAADSATFTGRMAGFLKEFAEGSWISFGPLRDRGAIAAGRQTDFAIDSPDLPALVACRAHGGSLMIKGVGEEPPTVLENLYLGHDAWPHGYTIGPDERLGKMSLKERSNYLVEHLPQVLELGWMENQKVMQWYETNLKAGKVAEVRARTQKDFEKKLITSEVYALMTYLLR
jgi:hypothetical protein